MFPPPCVTASRRLPEDRAAAGTLADEILQFPSTQAGEGVLLQQGQRRTTAALCLNRFVEAQQRLPGAWIKQFGPGARVFLAKQAQPAPADVFGRPEADHATG